MVTIAYVHDRRSTLARECLQLPAMGLVRIAIFQKFKCRGHFQISADIVASDSDEPTFRSMEMQPRCYKLLEEKLLQLNASSQTLSENVERLGCVNNSIIR